MNYKKIQTVLETWYNINKRELPWRSTSDAYKIWISEIILQQTRVNQGLEYYLRFIETFPTVKKLAIGSEDEVLKLWQGLGYYSRGRNLHKAAKIIATQYNGNFPIDYKKVLQLPGIGKYTAAAICSFAYNQNYAVLDGNVYRVLSRLFAISTPINTGVGEKEFTLLAENLLDKSNSHTHNQAIMEFGALQCTPKNPDCSICPLNDICQAYKLNLIAELPVKKGKTTVLNRYFNYFFISFGEYIYLQKRTKKDIWQNLYELPLIETENETASEKLFKTPEFNQLFSEINELNISDTVFQTKHILSHRNIMAKFYNLKISNETEELKKYQKVKLADIDNFAISRLTEIFFEKNIF